MQSLKTIRQVIFQTFLTTVSYTPAHIYIKRFNKVKGVYLKSESVMLPTGA